MAETDTDKRTNLAQHQGESLNGDVNDRMNEQAKDAGKSMIDPRDREYMQEDGVFPQGDEIKKVHPGAVGGRRADSSESTLVDGSQHMGDMDDNFQNTRDPQETADNNITQYTTGRPI